MKTIMIIAGESSGELYGALLANALKARCAEIRFIGMGGRRMEEAGVEILAPISEALGLVEIISSLSRIKAAFNRCVEALREARPSVLVLIDYPDFNLKLAAAARSFGIPVLYYVSPQVWAWRKGRVKKIAQLVDRMAVILPFEVEIYRKQGVPCEFVGHPILEEIDTIIGDSHQSSAGKDHGSPKTGQDPTFSMETRSRFKSALGLDPKRPLISLLPGSRPGELKRHLPLMAQVLSGFGEDSDLRDGNYQFCVPLAPNTDETEFSLHLASLRENGAHIRKGESVKVLAASDAAVVASGTATLQTALLEVPMVVIYRLSSLTYHLGKLILDVKHISLVNILLKKEVVVELIQKDANRNAILRELKRVLSDSTYREAMLTDYRKMKEPFLGKKTSELVAQKVLELAVGHEIH